MPAEPDPHRLPRAVEPQRYELTLAPDLPAARFTGEEQVRVVIHEAVDEVVLNALDLEIHDASLTDDEGRRLEGTVAHDEKAQRAVVSLPERAEPGHWTLLLTFTGSLNDKLRGFYRSTFTDEDGNERVIATTQFEATDARRAFPCWDEPDRKAVFAVRLVVDADLTAISNAAVVSETDLGNGKRQVEFADTMRMSTYLVAFVVGPLELTDPVDVDGTSLRVACVPGKRHLAGFAVDCGAHALRFFSSYFGLPYPGDKLDLIAIPDFAFGAMENLGAVTFRESVLLIDPETSSRLELERVADVIAHEIAHMWFGDLVTMRWWNGIWLNEAFATFMELLCVDDYRPEWKRWVSFSTGRAGALLIDGLRTTRPVEFPVQSPEEAEGMFDVLTYQKGAAVLRMLERYIGGEPFQAGIAHYLRRYVYDNAETTDLWDAIEEATGEPARSTMDSWIFQGGYPLVSLELDRDRSRLSLAQAHFQYTGQADGERTWRVPVLLRASVAGAVESHRLLLDTQRTDLDLGGACDWAVVNAGGWGFYRVRYPSELLQALVSDLDALDAIERYNLVSDTWAAALAGRSPVADFLELALGFQGEDDPDVWSALLGPLAFLDHVIADDDRPAVQAFVRRLVGPAFERLGWERDGHEAERMGTLRARLLDALGTLGADPAVRERAGALHRAVLEDRGSVDPNLVPAATKIVARSGGPSEYEQFLARFRDPATPQEEMRYLYGLADFQDRDLVTRTLAMTMAEVRTQNAPFLIGQLLQNRAAGDLAWSFVTEHWDEICDRFPPTTLARMLDGITGLSANEVANDVHRFLDAHPVPSGQLLVDQARERLDIAVAFRQREAAQLAELLAAV